MDAPQSPRISASLEELESAFLDSESVVEDSFLTDVEFEQDAEYIEILSSRLAGVAFTAAVLDSLTFADVELNSCELSGARLDSAKFTRVELTNCRMGGFDAARMLGQDLVFGNCKLDGANFQMSELQRVIFSNCELSEVDFADAQLRNVRFENCNLRGSKFKNARCADVDLAGSQVEGIAGVDGLNGASIEPQQVLALAPAALAHLGIRVLD